MTKEKSELTVVGDQGQQEGGEAPEMHAETRREILVLRDRSEESYWMLADKMAEAYEQSYYREWGYENWREYVEKELDMQTRTAQYFIQLAKWFKTIPKNVQEWVRAMGWSKAKILMRVVTKENAAEWKRKVQGRTLHEIELILQGARNAELPAEGTEGTKEGPERLTKMSFSLFTEQRKIVDAAIEKAKEESGSDKPGHLLELVCTEFLASNAANLSRDDYLRSVERITGLSIMAYDEAKDDLVFGADTIERVTGGAAKDVPAEDQPEAVQQ